MKTSGQCGCSGRTRAWSAFSKPGVRLTGKVIRVVEWFGYKFHLLVDVKHEVALAYRISSTKTGDNEMLPDLLQQARVNLPAGRIQTLAYDKAADDEGIPVAHRG